MKTLTCKMCGSTQLIEENGMYLCQSCGTKYSASELDDRNKTDETPSPEILKEEVETQEEIKRLRALVKDDYSLWSRILELDDGDWESYYYCYCNSILFYKNGSAKSISTSYNQERFGRKLSRVFEKLKDRASSDSEVKMCIKEVIYRDFKKWATDRLGVDSDYCPNYHNSEEVQEIMQIIRNRFIVAFGDDYSDFFNELVKDLDKLIEETKEKYDRVKIREIEKEIKEKVEKEKKDRKINITLIICLIISVVGFVLVLILSPKENYSWDVSPIWYIAKGLFLILAIFSFSFLAVRKGWVQSIKE